MYVNNTNVPADLTRAILGAAISVHRELGPGLLESTYRACLLRQLEADGLAVAREVEIPIRYKNFVIEAKYRADVIVEGKVLVELKAVDNLAPLHDAQVLTYLHHARLDVGLLINFNVNRLMSGVRRLISRNVPRMPTA
jgi:GxxExxY protein